MLLGDVPGRRVSVRQTQRQISDPPRGVRPRGDVPLPARANPPAKTLPPLTDAIVRQTRCPRIIFDTVERHAESIGASPSALRVLDFGCGQGVLVAQLLGREVDAYGVDIIAGYLATARPYFERTGLWRTDRLSLLNDAGRSAFPDGHFDVIVSDQLCEHIGDIDRFLAEHRRLLKPNGVAVHILPARWRVMEAHIGVPFAQWVNHARLRRAMIGAWLRVVQPLASSRDIRTQADRLNRYMDEQTFYRSTATLRRAFAGHGLRLDVHGASMRKLTLRTPQLAAVLRRVPLSGRVFTALFSNFQMLQFYAVPAGPTGERRRATRS